MVLKGREFARAFHRVAQSAIDPAADGTKGKFNKKTFKKEMRELLYGKIRQEFMRGPLESEWSKSEQRLNKEIDLLADKAAEAHTKGSLKFTNSFYRACKKIFGVLTKIAETIAIAVVASLPILASRQQYQDRYFLPREMEGAVAQVATLAIAAGAGLAATRLNLSPKAKPYAGALRDLTSSFERELDIIAEAQKRLDISQIQNSSTGLVTEEDKKYKAVQIRSKKEEKTSFVKRLLDSIKNRESQRHR